MLYISCMLKNTKISDKNIELQLIARSVAKAQNVKGNPRIGCSIRYLGNLQMSR